eukprot:XP_001710225.1 Hypothetical protein GL50803_38425 [Giardia lamblia ATCC 50803]
MSEVIRRCICLCRDVNAALRSQRCNRYWTAGNRECISSSSNAESGSRNGFYRQGSMSNCIDRHGLCKHECVCSQFRVGKRHRLSMYNGYV